MFKKSLILSTLILCVGCGDSSNTVQKESSVSGVFMEESINNQTLLTAINQARSVARDCYPDNPNRGQMKAVKPLIWNTQLYASALEHSTDLANSNTFSHLGSGTKYDITGDGKASTFFERILSNGYSNYYTLGENIAGGQQSIKEVMKAWLASPGHCTNIMKSSYTEVGIALVENEDSTYGTYWTQNFGTKKNY